MSRDHLRELKVVEKESEMRGIWGCMMIWFWLVFVVMELVL